MLRITVFLCLVILQCTAVEISNGHFEATTLTKKPIETSNMNGEVDDWTYSEAGLSNDASKVGDNVRSGNQFAFVDPSGYIYQDVELEAEKTYLISWADASIYDSAYTVTVTRLVSGIEQEFHIISSPQTITATQQWSFQAVFVTPLKDAKYRIVFHSSSKGRFYVDRVAIKEVTCEPRDVITDPAFSNNPSSSVWNYDASGTEIKLTQAGQEHVELTSGSFFAFCAPLFVGTYTFEANFKLTGSASESSSVDLVVSATEQSSASSIAGEFGDLLSSSDKTAFSLKVETQGMYGFVFSSRQYGQKTTYSLDNLALSARIGTDTSTGLPIQTGVTTIEIIDPNFDLVSLSSTNSQPNNMDSKTQDLWLFSGKAGITKDNGRLPTNWIGFSSQFAYIEAAGTMAQGIHLNANTDIVISFLTVAQPNSIPSSGDLLAFDVLITTRALNEKGVEADYPVYFSDNQESDTFVRRAYVFFTTATSGYYRFTITSQSQATLLFDGFTISQVVCDSDRPYNFDFHKMNNQDDIGPDWELFGPVTIAPINHIPAGAAIGQCVVVKEPSEIRYKFNFRVNTGLTTYTTDDTPLVVQVDSIYGTSVAYTYTTKVTGTYDPMNVDSVEIDLKFDKWNIFTANKFSLPTKAKEAGFGDVAPPQVAKYFVIVGVLAKEGTDSQPMDKSYSLDGAITPVERDLLFLELNHAIYGQPIYVPQGVKGIADVFIRDSQTYDDTKATYTVTFTPSTAKFDEAPAYDAAKNELNFKLSQYANGEVTITVKNDVNNIESKIDLFVCQSMSTNIDLGREEQAVCIRTETHPRDVFVRKDIVKRVNVLAELQPGDWYKNQVLDCECKLHDMPAKQPKYIWVE